MHGVLYTVAYPHTPRIFTKFILKKIHSHVSPLPSHGCDLFTCDKWWCWMIPKCAEFVMARRLLLLITGSKTTRLLLFSVKQCFCLHAVIFFFTKRQPTVRCSVALLSHGATLCSTISSESCATNAWHCRWTNRQRVCCHILLWPCRGVPLASEIKSDVIINGLCFYRLNLRPW